MRRFIPIVLSAAAISLAQTTAPVQRATTAPATQAAATTPAPLDPKWGALLARLTAEETREAAKTELAELPDSQRPSLALLVPHASGSEIKSLLEARLLEMDISIAVNPPPISIDLKNASLEQIAKALNKILGTTYEVWPPNDNSGSCTLKMDDTPFWEVFAEINKQFPLTFQDFGDSVRLTRGSSPLVNMKRINGLALFPMTLTRSSTVNFREPAGKQFKAPSISFSLTLMVDPRIKVVSAQTFLTEVVDDNGNVLLKQKAGSASGYSSWRNAGQWPASFTLSAPENLGSKIISAKGVIKVNLALESISVEVDDLEKKFKKPITIGKRTVTFSQFKVNGSQIEYNLRTDQGGGFFGGGPGPAIAMTIVDANDQVIYSTNVSGGLSGNTGADHDIATPVKLRLSMSTRTREVPFNFELKDLPLPPK